MNSHKMNSTLVKVRLLIVQCACPKGSSLAPQIVHYTLVNMKIYMNEGCSFYIETIMKEVNIRI